VPFDELNVGGYAVMSSEDEREKKIRADYNAFLRKRAGMVRKALEALSQGRNWPNEVISEVAAS
jgi:hypothetical protein